MRTLLISSLAFFLASGTAFAASTLDPSQAQFDHGPAVMSVSDGAHGSTSVRTDMHSGEHRDAMDHMMTSSTTASSINHGRPPVRKIGTAISHGVPGTVASVSSNGFTMTFPGGGDHASTSITVMLSSSTKFMQGSSTAMLSNVVVGSRVEVFGKVSTSTKTIAAERVRILPAHPEMRSENNSTEKSGIFSRVRNSIFGNHGSSTSERRGTSTDSAAAVEGSGLITALFHAFLNLF